MLELSSAEACERLVAAKAPHSEAELVSLELKAQTAAVLQAVAACLGLSQQGALERQLSGAQLQQSSSLGHSCSRAGWQLWQQQRQSSCAQWQQRPLLQPAGLLPSQRPLRSCSARASCCWGLALLLQLALQRPCHCSLGAASGGA